MINTVPLLLVGSSTCSMHEYHLIDQIKAHMLQLTDAGLTVQAQVPQGLRTWRMEYCCDLEKIVEIFFGLPVESGHYHYFLRIGKSFKPKVFDLISSLPHLQHVVWRHYVRMYDVEYISMHLLAVQ